MAQIFTTETVHPGYMRVNSCGHQWLGDRDYHTVREIGRIDYSVHYVNHGKGSCMINGRDTEVPKGSLMLHFPGVVQDYAFKMADDSQILWAHFSGSACEILDVFRSTQPVIVKIRDTDQFEAVFWNMITAHNNRLTYGQQLRDSYMPVLLALMTQPSPEENGVSSQRKNEKLDQVISIMNLHYQEPIQIDAYAEFCHLSVDRFIRAFKAYTGMPPYRYQLNIRIQKAVDLLENTGINVSQCSEAVGFSDCAYFCRIFKKFTGHPPSYYRASNRR